MKRRKGKSLFDRAYDKAARCLPGQDPGLTEEEEQVLLAAIRAYDRRKQAALERFLQYLKEEGVEIPHLQAKLLFKQYWMEGRIR